MKSSRIQLFGLIFLLLTAAVGAVALIPRLRQAALPQEKAGIYYCPMHPTYTSDKPGTCPICNMSLVKRRAEAPAQPAAEARQPSGSKKILYWTDPMIPGFKSDKPGKSPMGMELVAVYAEEHPQSQAADAPEGYAPVLLTPQKQQLIGVTTQPVVRRALARNIRTVGVIAHDPELYQAQQEFIQADRFFRQATGGEDAQAKLLAGQMLDANRLRLRHLGLSEAMIDELAGLSAPDHRLLLGGAGQFWVYASIYEYELPLVHPGQAATVSVSALPGEVFEGAVKAIDPMLDEMTRTARARIVVNDPKGLLKPAMYVNVSIKAGLGQALAVPQEAVFSTGEQHVVFVDKGQGLMEPRKVVLGRKAEGFYEIQSGVAEGEPVVTSGNFLIDSESRLKGALEGAAGGHQHGL